MNATKAKPKLILGVTIGGSSRLLDGQAAYFRELGYGVFLISQDHFKEPIFCKKEGIRHLPVDIDNSINPIKDLKAFFQIIRHFRRVKPDIVNLGTAKMGLLGMMAARLLGVKRRIYTCHGLLFETEKGLKRRILMALEWFIERLAHRVIFVGPSLRDAAVRAGVGDAKKGIVIGEGSNNGVNVAAFNRNRIDPVKQESLRKELGLEGCIVIGFAGRVSLYKGCYELVEVFEQLYESYPNLRLIMMGHIKCDEAFEQRFRAHPGIVYVSFQDDVPLYMSLFDIFVLPSWREGFPNVPIQAAAMGLPVVVSDATGCVDSVGSDFNGTIYPVRDKEALCSALRKYIENPELRAKHGQNGLLWAANFKKETIWDGIKKVYEL